ncbi:hypothetical protein [Arthrobacter sp. Br18]|uniref:hypothetical protein n=1 Tax=Arthrobacter sp. Br18 TaxID=1312954 RepID=UPI00047BD315|nr:hypothetical protein [Arthrobacter sp. Br18]
MSTPRDENRTNLDNVIEPDNDALPNPIRQSPAGMPERIDDDALAAATEQERVDAGLIDYAPDQVPPAADPPPPGTSEAAELAQRGLTDEDNGD